MANFDKLEMSQELLSHHNLRIEKSFMGLSKRLVYIPTGSPVKVIKCNYNADAVGPLMRVIDSNDEKSLVAAVKACRVEKLEIGNIELDVCLSSDKRFMAMQLLQFGDYTYRPISRVAIFEGEMAQAAALVL